MCVYSTAAVAVAVELLSCAMSPIPISSTIVPLLPFSMSPFPSISLQVSFVVTLSSSTSSFSDNEGAVSVCDPVQQSKCSSPSVCVP